MVDRFLASPWVLFLAFAIFAAALMMLWTASRRQRALGIPAGRIVLADTGQWSPVEKALYDPGTGLTGRPDYLVQKSGIYIPVEVKSQPVGESPYDSHIYQLAAYCLLVERHFHRRPPYGILHYPNRTYEIDFTPTLESALVQLVAEMQLEGKKNSLDRSHESARRCQGCGYCSICDQRLS